MDAEPNPTNINCTTCQRRTSDAEKDTCVKVKPTSTSSSQK